MRALTALQLGFLPPPCHTSQHSELPSGYQVMFSTYSSSGLKSAYSLNHTSPLPAKLSMLAIKCQGLQSSEISVLNSLPLLPGPFKYTQVGLEVIKKKKQIPCIIF